MAARKIKCTYCGEKFHKRGMGPHLRACRDKPIGDPDWTLEEHAKFNLEAMEKEDMIKVIKSLQETNKKLYATLTDIVRMAMEEVHVEVKIL